MIEYKSKEIGSLAGEPFGKQSAEGIIWLLSAINDIILKRKTIWRYN